MLLDRSQCIDGVVRHALLVAIRHVLHAELFAELGVAIPNAMILGSYCLAGERSVGRYELAGTDSRLLGALPCCSRAAGSSFEDPAARKHRCCAT